MKYGSWCYRECARSCLRSCLRRVKVTMINDIRFTSVTCISDDQSSHRASCMKALLYLNTAVAISVWLPLTDCRFLSTWFGHNDSSWLKIICSASNTARLSVAAARPYLRSLCRNNRWYRASLDRTFPLGRDVTIGDTLTRTFVTSRILSGCEYRKLSDEIPCVINAATITAPR